MPTSIGENEKDKKDKRNRAESLITGCMMFLASSSDSIMHGTAPSTLISVCGIGKQVNLH